MFLRNDNSANFDVIVAQQVGWALDGMQHIRQRRGQFARGGVVGKGVDPNTDGVAVGVEHG